MKLATFLLAVVLASPSVAIAQQFDFGDDVDGYHRFLIYPHLQKGWESVQRGDRARALAELERARSLAPESVVVALHLAEAYRKFGLEARAESVLREQLKRAPDDSRLRSALGRLRRTPEGARRPQTEDGTSRSAAEATQHAASVATSATRTPSQPAQSQSTQPKPAPRTGETAATVVARTWTGPATSQLLGRIPTDKAPADPRHLLSGALPAERLDDVEREAERLLVQHGGNPGLLDEITYQFVQAGAVEQPTRLLLQFYPFAGGTPAERERLLKRLTLLVDQQRGRLADDALAALRAPLDTPWLRSEQAAFWGRQQDCGAVRALLDDLSPDYRHDDLVRLGDCYRVDSPASAQRAYLRAHELQPGGAGSRALAYLADAAGDYPTAVVAWRSVGVERMSDDELLAAASTAVAAGAREQAADWLTTYRERSGKLEYRYWSLVAENDAGRNDASAAAALERAVEFHAEASDYVRLARLQTEPSRQVYWLERAAALDRNSATVLMELGYAYARTGQTVYERRVLDRAIELEPGNANLQMELGYYHWRAGRLSMARGAFERAWRADQGNIAVGEQLVYVHQQLKDNKEARTYAEHVLDALASSSGTTTAAPAALDDRVFGLQRLHEDLGRRVTVSLDGWSGTRLGTGALSAQPGTSYTSYSLLQVDYRLGVPIRSGTTLSAYARVIADGGAQRSAVGSQNSTLGVGLRWKPLRSQVFYLAGEHQTNLESGGGQDLLLRASASFLNRGRTSDDWHPSGPGWFAHNLSLDAAHYVDAHRSAYTADYRTSYHGKAASSQAMQPYAHLQVTGLSATTFERDIRVGTGVRWNLWYGADRYDAARHKLTLGVEFQQALDTYLPDRHGVFFSLGTRW